MRKRDLLLTGLILTALPLGAQEEDYEFVNPVRSDKDARTIFVQNFEPTGSFATADEAWEAWQDVLVDTIQDIYYYTTERRTDGDGTGNGTWPNIYSDDNKKDFTLAVKKDTTINMYNGVLTTDGVVNGEKAPYYDNDDYRIVLDQTPDRSEIFKKYGEDGGDYVFRYTSGKCTAGASEWGEYHSDGSTANYRRNLFIRGLDIEENTSYRLTYYIKATKKGAAATRLYSEVMRGYFTSEKPFTMGYVANNDSDHKYEWNTQFSLQKTEFKNGEWEKVTMMTHYLNDSIAEAFMFADGYWWAAEWAYTPEGSNREYNYIKQPNKFFARFSFASDSTEFEIDNISLVKSNIGGAEYYENMIRINFGFETNLAELARKAKTPENAVESLELPGEYFSVYAHMPAEATGEEPMWIKMKINSAEYHSDGYMYMWTKDDSEGNPVILNPQNYDSVLVSFTNPDDPKMMLKYTGAQFPNAIDTEWVMAGKKVFNFYNEVAIPNPNIEYNQFNQKVYSMKNLPPTVNQAEYEQGSFSLPTDLSSMWFKFSRPVLFDKDSENPATNLAMLKVEQAGKTEYWFASTEDNDSIVTFTRSKEALKNGPLVGDYVFTLVNVMDESTDFAAPYAINYSFTESVAPKTYMSVTFNDETVTGQFTSNGESAVEGFSSNDKLAIKVGEFGGLYDKAIMFGLYGVGGLQNGTSDKTDVPMMTYEFTSTLEDGEYPLTFVTSGCNKGSWNDACRMIIRLFDANDAELATIEEGGSNNKPDEGKPVYSVDENVMKVTLKKNASYKVTFQLPDENSYNGGHKGGRVLYEIKCADIPLLGWPSIRMYNSAISSLNKNLEYAKAEGKEDDFTGAVYDEAVELAAKYATFKDTKPSAYKSVSDEIIAASNNLLARFDIVNALIDEVDKALQEQEIQKGVNAEYVNLVAFTAIDELWEEVDEFSMKNATDDSIKAVTKLVTDAIKALTDRVALIKKFNDQVATTQAVIDAKEMVDAESYATMLEAFNANKDADVIAATDAELNAAIDAIIAGQLAHDSYVSGIKSATVGVKSLIALATKLNVQFEESVAAEVQARVDALVDDDQALADIYRSAIKVALYKKMAEGELAVDYDLSGFVKNQNLYSAAVLDDDLEYYYYQWGSPNNRWKMKNNYTSEQTFPGWIARATGGNVHAGIETANWTEPKAPIFDAYIGLDWSSSVTMTQDVVLPVGYYNIGVGINYSDDDGAKKASFMAHAEDSTYTAIATNKSGDVPVAANTWLDTVKVVDNDVIGLEIKVNGSNSWTRVDNVEVTLIEKLKDFDYEAAAKAEEATLAELLTFVDMAAAENATVSYYTLEGIKIDAPKAGSVIIKVTESADGKRQAQKILVK